MNFYSWSKVASLLCLLLTACALSPPQPTPDSPVSRCLNLYDSVDQVVQQIGSTPSSPTRIEGFPYLRVNRFLASYRQQSMNQAERTTWLARLAELDHQVRQMELASLPQQALDNLTARYATADTLDAVLRSCSEILQTHVLNSSNHFALLRKRTKVPSDYHTFRQVLGLYPLTVLPVSAGVSRWQQETRLLFALPREALPVHGELHRFCPPDHSGQAPSIAPLSQDALGIPRPAPEQLAALFSAHAPVWEIDVAGDFDLPGSPFWQAEGIPTVDMTQPVVYRYPSFTRWQGKVLLQLNYMIWFSERPRSSSLDILGGRLDGLLWRVTLDSQGMPLIYDTIHPCGCYHLFFPTAALRLRPQAAKLLEPPLVPQPAPIRPSGTRIVVRVSSGSHYVQRVYADAAQENYYTWRDYQSLYTVPAGGGRRSLFDANGLVAGTERGERWLLWPMGILSPGAMRERGRHATAFVGRRHFDDPHLLDQLFHSLTYEP